MKNGLRQKAMSCVLASLLAVSSISTTFAGEFQTFRDDKGNVIGSITSSGSQMTFRDSKGTLLWFSNDVTTTPAVKVEIVENEEKKSSFWDNSVGNLVVDIIVLPFAIVGVALMIPIVAGRVIKEANI